MTQGPILRIGVGMDHMIDCLQKKRIWKLISNLGQSMVSSPSDSEIARPLVFLLELPWGTIHSVEAGGLS